MVITEEKVLKALRVLAEQDQLTLLIQIVEKWGEKRPKTSKMAFLQAEAFCKLCMLEHAWQRLSLVDESPEKKALQVEVLLQRGWVSQAHKMLIMLQSLNPRHPQLEVFHKRIRQGVTAPSQSQAQEIIRRNDPQELFQFAEQCLCFGKSQVGQKILMHLLQRDIREAQSEGVEYIPNPYIQRLLWAHKGDFTASIGLHALLNQVSYHEEEGQVEPTVSLTELTNTGRQSSNSLPKESPFVALFKGEDAPVTMEELTAEVTSAFVFTDRQNDSTQRVDPFLDEDNGTVAIDVIEEEPEEDLFEATGAFDKSKFFKEANDDEVVVLLSGDAHTTELSKTLPTDKHFDVEVVDKVPTVDPELAKLHAEEKQRRDELEKAKSGNRKDTSVVRGAIFAVLVVLVLVLLAVWGIRKVAAKNLLSRSTPILLSADPQEVAKLKTQLENKVSKNWTSQQIDAEFLALTSYIYWRDFGGDQTFLDQANDLIEQVPSLHLSWVGKLTQVFMLMDDGNTHGAQELFAQIEASQESQHDLVQWGGLELSLEMGKSPFWSPDILDYPRVLVSAIEQDVMVPDVESENSWIQLVSLQQELGHMSSQEARTVLDELEAHQWDLGNEQRGLMWLLQSLYQENAHSPKSRLLRKKAYELAPKSAEVQFWLGMDYFWRNEPNEAMTLWGGCLNKKLACASGYVFVGKELALNQMVAERLDGLPDFVLHKELLHSYLRDDPANMPSNFWTPNRVDIEDDFWQSLEQAKADWLKGKETFSRSMWYSAWKATIEFQKEEFKYAYQWGLNAVQVAPDYTRMYLLLASTAKALNKDAKPFWVQFMSQEPQVANLQDLKSAIEG